MYFFENDKHPSSNKSIYSFTCRGNPSRNTLRAVVAQLEECCARRTQRSAPTDETRVAPTDGTRDKRIKLGDVVARFKSLTTHRYLDGVRLSNWPGFETRLWQRNYFEHIIRDEKDYQSVFDYVVRNPQNWEKDSEYLLK